MAETTAHSEPTRTSNSSPTTGKAGQENFPADEYLGYLPSPLEYALDNIICNHTPKAIHSLPSTADPTLKQILFSVSNNDAVRVHSLYAQIYQSCNPEVSALVSSGVLLRALFKIAFESDSQSDAALVVEQLLSVSPPPNPDMKSFINDPAGLGQLALWGCRNADIWSVMLKHGYMNADQNGLALGDALTHIIFTRGSSCFPVAEVLLTFGAEPKLYNFQAILRSGDVKFLDLLWGYMPKDALQDCRLLHDVIKWGKVELVCWLLDVAKMDVNLVPSQRPRVELEEFPRPGAVPDKNGTPLHEAARYNQKGVVSVLLKRGARKEIRNERRETAYEVAKERGNWYIMALLR